MVTSLKDNYFTFTIDIFLLKKTKFDITFTFSMFIICLFPKLSNFMFLEISMTSMVDLKVNIVSNKTKCFIGFVMPKIVKFDK